MEGIESQMDINKLGQPVETVQGVDPSIGVSRPGTHRGEEPLEPIQPYIQNNRQVMAEIHPQHQADNANVPQVSAPPAEVKQELPQAPNLPPPPLPNAMPPPPRPQVFRGNVSLDNAEPQYTIAIRIATTNITAILLPPPSPPPPPRVFAPPIPPKLSYVPLWHRKYYDPYDKRASNDFNVRAALWSVMDEETKISGGDIKEQIEYPGDTLCRRPELPRTKLEMKIVNSPIGKVLKRPSRNVGSKLDSKFLQICTIKKPQPNDYTIMEKLGLLQNNEANANVQQIPGPSGNDVEFNLADVDPMEAEADGWGPIWGINRSIARLSRAMENVKAQWRMANQQQN